jgi:hypothetical protein
MAFGGRRGLTALLLKSGSPWAKLQPLATCAELSFSQGQPLSPVHNVYQ